MNMSITHAQDLPTAIYSSPKFNHSKNENWYAQYSVGLEHGDFVIWVEYNEEFFEQVEKLSVSADDSLPDDLESAVNHISRRGYRVEGELPTAADLQILSVEHLEDNRS